MLKVVFDTVIFVRSLINPHSRCGEILFSHDRYYQLYLSEPIIREILEVLKRPELTVKFKSLKTMDFTRVLDILGQAQAIEVPFFPGKISRDPKDDIFILTAVAAGADYLVSEDRDLLVLKKYQEVQIVTGETFRKILQEYS